MPTSVDPATGLVIAEYAEHTPAQVSDALDAASVAQRAWADRPFADRSRILRGVGDALVARREELAQLMAAEMGKPISQGRAEVDKCALVCRYYADEGPASPRRRGHRHRSRRCPRGVPSARHGAGGDAVELPALAGLPLHRAHAHGRQRSGAQARAQRVGLRARHREPARTRWCARRAVPHVAARLVTHRRPRDRRTHRRGHAHRQRGRRPLGGRARRAKLKKCVLELGGSDPYVVLADADLAKAAAACASSRLINSGQSCIAAKRFIVATEIYDEFRDAFVGELANDGWARHSTRTPTSVRWRATTCATTSPTRWRAASTQVLASPSAERAPPGPAPTSMSPCSTTSNQAWPPSTRSCSVRSPR